MQKISLAMLRKKLIRYPHLNELEDFISKTLDKASPTLLILFGSLATNKFTQYSDIDVLCIFDRNFKDERERFLYSYRFSKGLVQTKTVSLDEFISGLINGNSFLHKIVDEGYILYSDIDLSEIEKYIIEGKKNLKVSYFHP